LATGTIDKRFIIIKETIGFLVIAVRRLKKDALSHALTPREFRPEVKKNRGFFLKAPGFYPLSQGFPLTAHAITHFKP
jgi:hypothetical protein